MAGDITEYNKFNASSIDATYYYNAVTQETQWNHPMITTNQFDLSKPILSQIPAAQDFTTPASGSVAGATPVGSSSNPANTDLLFSQGTQNRDQPFGPPQIVNEGGGATQATLGMHSSSSNIGGIEPAATNAKTAPAIPTFGSPLPLPHAQLQQQQTHQYQHHTGGAGGASSGAGAQASVLAGLVPNNDSELDLASGTHAFSGAHLAFMNAGDCEAAANTTPAAAATATIAAATAAATAAAASATAATATALSPGIANGHQGPAVDDASIATGNIHERVTLPQIEAHAGNVGAIQMLNTMGNEGIAPAPPYGSVVTTVLLGLDVLNNRCGTVISGAGPAATASDDVRVLLAGAVSWIKFRSKHLQVHPTDPVRAAGEYAITTVKRAGTHDQPALLVPAGIVKCISHDEFNSMSISDFNKPGGGLAPNHGPAFATRWQQISRTRGRLLRNQGFAQRLQLRMEMVDDITWVCPLDCGFSCGHESDAQVHYAVCDHAGPPPRPRSVSKVPLSGMIDGMSMRGYSATHIRFCASTAWLTAPEWGGLAQAAHAQLTTWGAGNRAKMPVRKLACPLIDYIVENEDDFGERAPNATPMTVGGWLGGGLQQAERRRKHPHMPVPPPASLSVLAFAAPYLNFDGGAGGDFDAGVLSMRLAVVNDDGVYTQFPWETVGGVFAAGAERDPPPETFAAYKTAGAAIADQTPFEGIAHYVRATSPGTTALQRLVADASPLTNEDATALIRYIKGRQIDHPVEAVVLEIAAQAAKDVIDTEYAGTVPFDPPRFTKLRDFVNSVLFPSAVETALNGTKGAIYRQVVADFAAFSAKQSTTKKGPTFDFEFSRLLGPTLFSSLRYLQAKPTQRAFSKQGLHSRGGSHGRFAVRWRGVGPDGRGRVRRLPAEARVWAHVCAHHGRDEDLVAPNRGRRGTLVLSTVIAAKEQELAQPVKKQVSIGTAH